MHAAPAATVVDVSRSVEMVERVVKRRRVDTDDATARDDPGAVIGGLPFDVVVTHVLREANLPDPADLAVLRV